MREKKKVRQKTSSHHRSRKSIKCRFNSERDEASNRRRGQKSFTAQKCLPTIMARKILHKLRNVLRVSYKFLRFFFHFFLRQSGREQKVKSELLAFFRFHLMNFKKMKMQQLKSFSLFFTASRAYNTEAEDTARENENGVRMCIEEDKKTRKRKKN